MNTGNLGPSIFTPNKNLGSGLPYFFFSQSSIASVIAIESEPFRPPYLSASLTRSFLCVSSGSTNCTFGIALYHDRVYKMLMQCSYSAGMIALDGVKMMAELIEIQTENGVKQVPAYARCAKCNHSVNCFNAGFGYCEQRVKKGGEVDVCCCLCEEWRE